MKACVGITLTPPILSLLTKIKEDNQSQNRKSSKLVATITEEGGVNNYDDADVIDNNEKHFIRKDEDDQQLNVVSDNDESDVETNDYDVKKVANKSSEDKLSVKKGYLTPTEIETLYSLLNKDGKKILRNNCLLHWIDYSEDETSNNTRTPKEEELYKRRIAMLRLKSENSDYKSLTGNLHKINQSNKTDENSMANEFNKLGNTAALALNMMIGPIVVGCFLYTFCSGLFSNNNDTNNNNANNTSLIIFSVLGGVALLFIELILFVIRTDAMISHSSKTFRKTNRKWEEEGGVADIGGGKALSVDEKLKLNITNLSIGDNHRTGKRREKTEKEAIGGIDESIAKTTNVGKKIRKRTNIKKK